MKIDRIKLLNWCQYDSFEAEFGPGLIRIHGRNGAGKTNFVEAMVYGLTGKTRTDGNLKDNIRYGKPAKERAGVEVTLSHNNAHMQIQRNLYLPGQKLTVRAPGTADEVFDKAAAINLKLEEVLGIDEDMLLKYIFVAQWKIFEFLELSDEKVNKFLSRLFNVDVAEDIWKALGEYKVTVPVPSVDVDAIRAAIAESDVTIRDARAAIAELPSDAWDRDSDLDQKTCRAYQERRRLEERVANLRSQIDEVMPAFRQAEGLADSARRDVKLVEDLVESERDAYAKVKEDLTTYKSVARLQGVRASLTRRLDEAKARLKGLRLPEEVEGYVEAGGPEEEELSRNTVRLVELGRFLKTFNELTGVGECPTCGTETSALQEKLSRYREEHDELSASVEVLRRRKDQSRAYDVAAARARDDRAGLRAGIAELTQQLSVLETVDLPDRDVETLELLADEYRQNEEALKSLRSAAESRSVAYSRLQGSLGSLQNMLLAEDAKVQMCRVTADEAAEAAKRLQEKAKQYEQRDLLSARLELLEASREMNVKTLRKAEEVIRQGARARSLQEHLQSMRNVFHRNNLQRRVAQANLELLQRGINDVLERFDAPFVVQVQDGLKFNAIFRNGTQTPATRLSGGEKTVFALAFRIAVNARYAKDLGLLVLDEPTAGLDEWNLPCLDAALGRLREVSKSRGLQVILITHEKMPDSLFDQVIDLPSRR